NSQLAKHNPPSVITDLFTDIKKGQVLLDLLEVLSGQQLAREKGSNTFQCRSNIEHALTFLKKQSIKLINIHVTDIAEGNPSIILGLIWTIILHFHIEEVAWTLSCNYNQPSLDCVSVVDLSPASGPPPKKRSKAQARWKMSAKKALLLWAQEQCAMHGSVNVTDFKSSWRNGMAFLAVIHAVRPDLIDMDSVKDRSSKDNLKEAFRIAELELNIPRLLDPEDVDVINPDEKSIMTYVAQFLQYSKDLPVAGDEVREKVKDATVWLISQEEKLHKLQMESEKETYFKKSQVTFVESFNEEKKAFLDVLSLKRNVVGLVDDQSRLRQAWDKLTNQINEWTAKLDQILPPPLDQIEVWLQEIEHLIAEDLPDSQNYNQTMALIKERISSFKSLMDEFDRHLSSLLKFENKDEQHMPMVPPDKLEEMRRRFHNIMGTNFIGLLEFHYYLCSVLGLIEEVKSKLNLWNIKYGTRESVELLLGDWHKFIEEKEFLIQLESSFKTCETMIKNLAGDPQNISKQFKMVESQISMCKKCMYNIKTTLQKVLSSWTTYTENLHSLKTWLEESRKEHPKQVPFETLASWNSVLTTINEVGKFLIDVSNQQVGSSINKELKRLNKRWAKFIKKTQFNLIARGSKYQELVTRKENALEIIAKNILSQVQLQHFHTSGLQTQIKEAKDKVQNNMAELDAVLQASYETSLEIDVRAKFEKSQKELESDITKAQQLLRSKGNPGNLVSQKKDILAILNSKNLDKFLKTAEQLKNIVPPDEKLSLEQISRELSKEWEVLHQEICLYIYRIKIEIEKRLTENISKLEKQLNKEKKLLSKGKTKGLIEEHEACFFDEGSLCQLDLHMEALRELSEELTSEESRQEIRKTIIDYGQRQNEIKNAASEIYMMLKAVNENTQMPRKKKPLSTSENGGRDAGKMVQPSEPNDATSEERDNLELQLQSNKVRVLSEFPSEKERSISCLKDKLTDLQVLKNETDSCWTEFEITSSNLEKIVKDPERSTLSQTREKLKRKEEELQVILSKRMKSLEAALRIVLPVEKEAFLLVDSEQFLHKINIQEFNLAGVDDVYQNLKDIQRCIVKQIELCNNLEPSGSSALNEFNWIDLDAIQSIIVKYRAQFEEMNIKMQNSEMAIKALEDFLALLRKVKLSLQSTTDFSTSDIPEMQENSWTIEDVQKKISLMKEEAKCLDQRMKMLDISLKDAEQGEDTCCEKLVEVFSKMIDETHGHNEHEDFTEQVQLQEVFVAKNTDVLKNIKYIQDQINKIGLKDPTIPAVKQRIKSLTKLEKDLDYYAEEINYLKKMASSLPELKDGKGETPSQQCQETTCLWEDAMNNTFMMLLLFYQLINVLKGIIEGYDNLSHMIEVVREEFNEHSEDVEKINQICKNLQFQLNKMITFEEPPFEKEANVIVDRWLDINEKTENYYDNLVRALALWDKLLNLTSIIDEWIEKVLRKVEVHKLNDAERTQVQEELKIQEQNSAKFGARLVEIEEFLQISEPPLELQVIKSSLLNRIEQIKMHLMDKSTLSEVNGSTAELKEDLDQAKTQIGMTESLLKALSPSDSLEIFTKLEEIQQQILQQKHNMILLENQIGCLTPELSELKKQYESINDLFSTKKRTLQDHFSNLLNDQCKKFDDWFSNIQLTLKECFESPETKKCMEEKLQKLNDSLTFEGKTKDIQEVQTALNNVKRHLPKASVKRLSNWIVARELELQKMKFSCQMQAKQLHDCLQQLLRLQEDYINLSKWLMNQEEKWKEIGVEKEPDFFCQALTRKRQLFESLAELNNSLKKFGLTREEIVIESTNLIEKYETFLTQVCEKGNHQSPAAVDQSFEDLVHDVFSWIMGIKESLMVLNSTEGKMPLEERIQKIKEIILLKPEGDMKIQNIMSLGETGKASLVQDTLSDIKNQWDHTIHLANTYLSHQEKIQLEGEKYLQSKDDLRLMLTELKKKQESGFALQNGLQGKKAQLKIYKKFLQKAEDLTSLLNELKTQGNYLLECTKNPKFSEEKWLEIKHLHESLLHQLQDSVSKLEGHVQEHQLYQDLVADLNTTLENFYQKFLGFPDNLVDEKAAEEKMLTLQELEALLNLKGDTLEKILVLAESIKQNSSSVGQKTIKDETDSLKYKYKNLENRLESVKEETENSFNSILKSKSEIKKKEETAMKKREEQVSSDTQDSIHESITVEKLKERGEVKKNSSLEMLLSKQLSPEAQESMKNIEDEQRVNELQNQPLDLDIISANEQLKEIEVLYRQLEAKKANIGSQEPIMLPHNTETSALNVKNIQHSENQLDRLLQALVTLKEDKERQYCLIKDFQDHLLAIKSSVKALSMEKENTKLKKLEKCLESIHKEKDSLSKLKEEQENLSSHLSEMDKKLAEKQVKQLELCWEQVEQWIQKKYSQQGAEWDEFQCLMNKIQDMENSLQDHQQQQQLKLNSPPELEEHKDLMFLATKLNIIKNNFSLLRGRVEHQMKRIWGKKEKKKLETAISNLQEQLEELEPLTKEKYSQMKNCKIMKKIQEAMLWVNNLLIGLDQTAALLPDNIVSQIKKHKMVHNEVLDKQPIIESLIEETKGVIPDLDQCEATDLNTFLDELQSLNQALVSKCTEIAEQLETRLEERSTFFEKLGKVQSSLQGKEVLITPEIKTASSKEDLDQYLVTLNDTQKELQNTDRLISTHFQEATDFSKCLNIFEQIFLIDQLRNLKNKARWTQRLMQNKHHEVRKKLDIYTEFFEKTDMLQQELSQIRNHALLLNRKPNHGTKEEICELRERTSVLQSNIIQIMKHKDIFESLGLNWDSSHLDKVQAELLKIITELEEKTEQLERVNIENVKLQTSLNELQMVTLQIKKELAEIVNDTSFSPESRLLSAQILSQRIEKATYLCQETIDLLSANETNKESFKQEIPQIRLLAEENNKLHKFLQNVVENFQPRSVGEKDFRDQLECALLVLTEVNFQLQQPLEVGLEIKHIQEEKDNCEALQKRVKAELCQIKAITVKEYPRQEDNSHETRDLESKVNELEDLQLQFDKGFALRMNILDEALENMKHFNKAVTRAVGLINSFKTKVNSHKIDLDNLGESQQLTDWKQEEFKALIVDLKNLTSKLENITGPKDKVQLEHVLLFQNLSFQSNELIFFTNYVFRCLKSYEGFNKTKQKICAILNKVEGGLQQSISQEAMSYREALERLEQSKNFVSDLVSTQEELTKLRQDFRCLRFMCTENDSICLLKTVSALWERWLSLFENAREWEMFCEELKQDWKFVSEEIEREAIILDNLQEEFPESTKPKEAATNKELSEALECFCQYEENLEREQLLFTLLLHRIKNILSVPESLEITESVPVLQEIRSMQDRCTKLSQKVQGNKELIQLEIEERNNISKEIMSLKNSLEKMTATFRDMPLEEHPEKEDHMEALQKIIDKEKLALENIMEKLRIKYSEMYTIVPAEIECQMEECKKALEDIDEKIRNEVLKSSPSYMMREKIEEINHGLQNVEKMLQQKSKNIEQAQEIQKKMWDELDLWHCKLNELDSEVQDIVEQDPGQAQEWMDNLMVPFQQYQQVSQRAEHRTSQLNKAILKMEEYNDFLRNTETWIENTSSLLAGPTDYSSSKALSHHANTLQMALEDSEQKQNLLHLVYSDLEEFSAIFETDDFAPIKLNQLSARVTNLQQKIIASLPQIQHMADEVIAIENEVKSIEKKVSKIKAILFSKEIFDFSPEEHLKHGEVILDNIKPMKKAIAEIESYQVVLRLPETGMKSLPVFERTNQLLQDVKMLEKATHEKNEILKLVMKQTGECDQEIEKLKYLLKNYSTELSPENFSPDQATTLPHVQREIDSIKEQILNLNQKKEDLLMGLKTTVLALHQRLQQEKQELEKETEESGLAERDVSEWKVCMTSVAITDQKNGDERTESASSPWSIQWGNERNKEEDRASSSSGTLIQFKFSKLWIQSLLLLIYPLNLLQGDTPSIGVPFQSSGEEQGSLEEIVASSRPESVEILHVCQKQVAELELWLDKANLSFRAETLNPEMQQMVEQELAGCQAMLTEIEHKVSSLLENAEMLSLKLKAVKYNLEKVQVMLQDKYSDEKRSNNLKKPSEDQKIQQSDRSPLFEPIVFESPMFGRQKGFQQKVMLTLPTGLKLDLHSGLPDSRPGPLSTALSCCTENPTSEPSLNLDKKIFDLLLSISQCLSNMEGMLQTSGLSREDAAIQQVHYEMLSLELQKLHSSITNKKEDLLKLISHSGKNSSVFFECFKNLQTRLEETRTAAASRSQSMKSGIDHNSDYQSQLRQLYDQLIEKKSSMQHSLNEISNQSIGEQLQKADSYAVKLQDYEVQVAKLRDEGERLYLPYVLIQEVYKLEDILDDMWGLLRAKHAELNSPFISESQQEGLLRGLVELLTIGKEKLGQDQRQQIKSKCSLQAQLQNHKGFFQKLVADVFLIQAYSKKALPPLLQNKEKFWTDMVKEVKLLEQHACQYGMKLENLLQKWKEFDENYESLEKDLEILGSSLPSTSLVEETEERLMERISFYQQIKRNIDEKHTKLYQTTNEGKHLTTAVNCPELDSQISKLEEQWLALNKKVDHELHRLQTLLKHLVSYNKDSDELTRWLESAQQTLNYWKEQSLNVSQDLDTIRSNINNFFEFSKEVDEKSSLKTSVISTGNQLLHLKEADTATLRSSLAQFEQKWATLITQLPDIQEKLHQLQMEKLPSRQAITEMINWMDSIEQQIADEATLDSQSSVSQVKNLLQKYKESRMEMNYKQWIVDFVNQSLLQLSTSDVESKRYERTEFAERLGEMNRQWHKLHGTLNRKIQHLEQLLESITESENKIQTLRSWMEAQGERLKALQKPGSVISVRRTLLDCQDLENHLTTKSRALDDLKQNYMALESGPMPVLQDTISGINDLYQMRNNIVNQVNQLKTSMQSVLHQEKGYDKLFEEVNMMTIRFWYCVEHSKPDVYSLEALRCQVKNLQFLQDEAESSEGNWSELQDAINKLKDYCPSVTEIIKQKYQEARTRWTQVNHEVAEQLQSAQSMLQLWESYTVAHTEATAKLDQLEEKLKHILTINMSGDNLTEILIQALKDAENLQNELQNIKETFLQNSAVIEPNLEQAGPVKQDVLSNQSSSLQRISYLEKMLLMKSNEFEHVLSQLKDFRHQLESLEDSIKHSVQSWDLQGREDDPERFLNHMLELTALSPDMEHLNEVSFKLPLSDIDIKTLQNLNRKWSQAAATALEKCSELQGTGSNEKFLHKCENWIQFLEKIEKCLKMNLAGRLEDLLEQQKTFEMLQAEISVNQPIADYFVTQSLQLLDTPEIEKRTEFVMKLTMLKEQWQDATQRAQQRKNTINERVKEWQRFNASLQNVIHFLTDTDHFLSAIKSRDCYSLCQIRSLIHDLKNKEVLLQRQQTTCTLILEAGRKLLMIADPETKDSIDRKTRELQDTWKNSQFQVAEITKQFQSTIETWDRCEKQIKELESKLHTLKAKIKDPLPEPYEELYKEKELIKELEKSLSNWAQNLKELNIMKADLTRYILVEDVMVLKEQIDHLHRQWEELCLRVSLRKQEIEERLNSWIVFNEKNKDLCAWLVQMENKVLQTADISIEEMIERLQKDCMEEINLFSENKLHLKQMGDQLIKASNKTRVAEIDDKLSKINDRWQHLFDVIGSRVKKLKETFAFIQQLDKNMSNLRSWLARIESELSKPVVYDICDDQEIQKRLAEQQDLQRDIEQHSAGVESVFNICDVLLHDSDACANETECDSIQQTTRSLDRRWRNICAMSMERRMKIEETWRLWQKFLDDYSRFEDWLKSAEKTAAHPNSSEVLYTNAKEELKKFEAFQWQIHERLTQLELINKQYRRLARENRTDTASKLKQMVHEGNQRWDNLQKRVTAILRRLKHFTNQREEFEGTRESILVWLTEMDLQLTNVEHFSESDVDDKMRQLHGFQQEITLNTNKIDQLIVFGEQLIQKSEPMDAVLIEDELEELHRYCQEVFGRVARFHRRLTSHNPGLEDEKEASENETDVEDSREIQTDSWHKKEVNEGPSSPQSLCHLMPPPLGHERSGCETPVSVDSIPLEWDHTGDVGGSSSHEDDEEGPYYSAVSGKSISEAHSWHTPDSPTHPKHHYKQTEVERNVLPITPETSTPYKPEYVKQLIPPGIDGVDDGREGSRMLNAGEQKGLTETEQQAGVFDSWKLIQAQDLRNKLRTKHNLQQWQQLDSDINDVTLWLKGTEAELEDLEMAKPAADIQETELRVKKLKDILKAFDNYKALVVSINLSSKKFQQPDNTESKELQNRLRQLNLLWEKANHLLDSWRESLQHSLMQCQDFHQLSQSLLLWLASAENRRCTVQAQVMDSNADPHTILECQKELMQLEKELLEHQHQVSSLQEISKYLLAKGDEDNYIEADEKVHVIGKKLNQLLDQVAQDLESLQDSQDVDTSLLSFDEVDSGGHHLSSTSMSAAGEKLSDPGSTSTSSGSRSFLYRVFRAALPLQLFFLLLLLLACMIPSSEEDYSCTQANNFARSFYPMLRYTNGFKSGLRHFLAL
uniref:Spectrin repeat containing nuclear envelope protein 2 n=1 Tax=Monodelphis domestica TaxID=13616 RepID=A0A5F8GSM9_MONDO